MQRARNLILLGIAAAAGALLLGWGYFRVAPFQPHPFRISGTQAAAVVLDRLRELGRPIPGAYVATRFGTHSLLERRLYQAGETMAADTLRATGLPDQTQVWEVSVYPPDALKSDFAARAEISPAGQVVSLHLHVDAEERGSPLTPLAARRKADGLLRAQGFDPGRYGEPSLRTQQLTSRTDLTFRYRDRLTLPDGSPFGMEVRFAGDQVADFGPWIGDGRRLRAAQRSLQSSQAAIFSTFLGRYGFLALLVLPFLKRYHEGEIGVRRGAQLFLITVVSGMLYVLMVAGSVSSQDFGFGFATPRQTSWFWLLIGIFFNVVPAGLLSFLAWSVGEWLCRKDWGQKLTSFDALFQRRFANATVATSALSGVLAGIALGGGAVGLLLVLGQVRAWPAFAVAGHVNSVWTGLEAAADAWQGSVPVALAVALCVLPLAARWLGRFAGWLVASAVFGLAAMLPLLVLPVGWGLLLATVFSAALLGVFLLFDLLAFLLAVLISDYLIECWPLLVAVNPALRAEGWVGLALLALPMLLTLRSLASRREITYRYEDVPPHVRRIAERERQRVELETARRIQSSILPDLPSRLAGVDLAHAYLPASEVGGDFYDVLALEDGRLALAVGDVAGHGVSSGLVMSMAKSALAVQVTFDPQVDAVFRTLNRTVYQSARKRLLATFCYALLDPVRRELEYASAGHLYPYRITADGRVLALQASGYPLGVRRILDMEPPRTARLERGDSLFFFSDGLVEACAEGSDDVFGFTRLEDSLQRLGTAGAGVEALRDGVLADVARYTHHAPREDDMTIVVVRLPG